MAERLVQANGVELCVESFGEPDDPAILLIAGAASSMLHWPEELCRRLTAGGRFVIRYDHRDTGCSIAYPPGAPGYTGADLAHDALAVLDTFGVPAAHLAGISMGGGIAQVLAVHHPARVESLTLIATGPIGPEEGAGEEPVAEEEPTGPDWADRAAAIEHLFALEMSCTSRSRPISEAFIRDLIARTVDRALSIASVENHFILDPGDDTPREALREIETPTLVIHGREDPFFPLASAAELSEMIDGARLLVLERAGHELPPADWDQVVPELLRHTATAGGG
jgi:pimeloyl-ACP methyl ester carboxylesterase